jgi:hypothetical protein
VQEENFEEVEVTGDVGEEKELLQAGYPGSCGGTTKKGGS